MKRVKFVLFVPVSMVFGKESWNMGFKSVVVIRTALHLHEVMDMGLQSLIAT